MVGNEVYSVNLTCGYCKKSAINKRVSCENCKAIFHTSCSSKKSKKCCDKQSFLFEEESVVSDSQSTLNISPLKMQNDNLEEINIKLSENIILLNEKIKKLEAENTNLNNALSKQHSKISYIPDENLINKIVKSVQATFESSFKLLRDEVNNLKTELNKESKGKLIKSSQDTKNINSQKTQQLSEHKPVSPKQYSQILNTKMPKQNELNISNKNSQNNIHEDENTGAPQTSKEQQDAIAP